MKLEFKGWSNPDGPVTDLIRAAIDFLADRLAGDDHTDHTMDVVILDDHLIGADGTAIAGDNDGESDVLGAVFFMGDHDTDQTTHFTLGFHPSVDDATLFLILCHEMVHVRQYITGDLRTIKKGDDIRNFWMDEEVTSTELDYFDLPWEVEAYEMQERLLSELVKDPGFVEAYQRL